MPKTDSAAVTILKRCDEVMERHLRVEIEGFAHCNYCGLEGVWPCDAYASARDLRDAVKATESTFRGIVPGMYAESCHHGQDHECADPTFHCCDWAHGVGLYEDYCKALTTIAERGEKA